VDVCSWEMSVRIIIIIIKDKLSNIFISEVCTKLVALRISLNTRRSSQLAKDW